VTDPLSLLEPVAAAFAIVGGTYGAYELVRRKIQYRPYTEPMCVFAGTNELRDRLIKLQGRTINFDTVLDFSVGGQLSSRIVGETEYKELLGGDARKLNGKRLPLYIVTEYQTLDSFASLIVDLKEKRRLKFSHGGTGIVQVRWTRLVGQFGGLDKLGSGCRQAANLSVSMARYASSGVRPARVE
jgi:hypothetical protein